MESSRQLLLPHVWQHLINLAILLIPGKDKIYLRCGSDRRSMENRCEAPADAASAARFRDAPSATMGSRSGPRNRVLWGDDCISGCCPIITVRDMRRDNSLRA